MAAADGNKGASVSIEELQRRAVEIARRYDAQNERHQHNSWGPKDRMMGFVTDVGELNELVMAKEGMRHVDDVDAKLAHELSDCLWSMLVLADGYGIDLEAAFLKTMDELEQRTIV